MENYASNSNKSKASKDKPRAEKVVKGEVISRPKPIGSRFKNLFLGGEAKEASRYILGEVLLPAFRNLIVDSIRIGTERVVYGESTRRYTPPYSRSPYAGRVTYQTPVNRSYPDPREPRQAYIPDQVGSRRRQQGQEVILSTKEEAETVVEMMIDVIDKYDMVSLADFYDLLGLPTNHVDNNWGWTFLNDVEIRQVREGWIIDLPPAEPVR